MNSKSIVLFLFLLLSTKFMTITFFSSLPYDIINLIISIYFIIYSLLRLNNNSSKNFKNSLFFLKVFLLGWILSSFTAYLDWSQDFTTTFVASRFVLWITFGFYLIKSNTKTSNLYKAFECFSFVYAVLSIIINIFPGLKILVIYMDVDHVHKIDEAFLAGIQFTLIPLYYIMSKFFIGRYSKKEFILFILITISILLSQNRATIFPLALLFLSTFFFYSRINVIFKIFLLSFSFLIISFTTVNEINKIYDETSEQLLDEDYPRIRGVIYFSQVFSKSNYGIIFGNSVGSLKTNYGYFMDNLKTNLGIYISDLGLFGTWVMFGFTSIISVFYPFFNIFKTSKDYLFFKIISLHVIFGFTMFTLLPEYNFIFFTSLFYFFDSQRQIKP